MLELVNVVRRYRADAPPVLDRVDFALEPGAGVAVVGPSGSGKSTLLNVCGALDRPDAGEVRFDGRSLAGLDDDALAAFRNRTVGFVFQEHHLLAACSALENVLVPALVPGAPLTAGQAEARARE